MSKYIVQIKHLEGEEIVEACGNQADIFWNKEDLNWGFKNVYIHMLL